MYHAHMTPMQRNFAINYAQTQNAEQSALAAGYSKKYARSHVQRLLKHPDVVAEIKRIRNKVNQMVEKNATDVVNQFSKIAFTDRVSFMKEDPERPGEYMYKAPHELTQDQRDCVETTKMYTTEIVVIEDKALAERSEEDGQKDKRVGRIVGVDNVKAAAEEHDHR